MNYMEQVLFAIDKLKLSPSMLSAIIGVTEKSLTADPPSEKIKLRIGRLVKTLELALQSGVIETSLYNMLDAPLTERTEEKDADCCTCLLYLIMAQEMPDREFDLYMQLGIEIWLRELEIDGLKKGAT